ncbi:thiamine phosphate synthase [Campylobacter pinnipediorum]|uniref:Thiamine-phosphate synthase n=1 Tax=Campylobacter pinnipediorum subsp. pinnipediorum TaxID=1660067 RepID=A0AAX0LAY1_9BACT|nr:thiamine phosphate synthase [Campylobacter pinnipediorum]AQW81066.1 thiamine phosphate synthase [Campylobacter pinnipediorum subsp. pinnipediorum]AQW82684.1 thiamine phosphate synthase [Campylobacter pinnipediorum subsp. pinnipediorum]AQW84371.1 thiamine phosphate synthase [Campylobacter pinnipediorum subsp. pinnipediorum]OPA77179.1 thiamine-phosphate diphosphorylase [Campylobacter pinnipediorum subsp. pinnipediorum]OPA78965.1 thiamine-phosphate diphosphorylase [Campylobacter pinnipediorum 
MSEIYALSDDILSPDDIILEHVEDILQSGIKYYQYRCKRFNKNEDIAREILCLCNDYNARFIINDDIVFAKRIGAKSVHIGKKDVNLKDARKFLGKDFFIGVSCYDSLELAKEAVKNGADYIAFGSIFTSLTKPEAGSASLDIITQAKNMFNISVCAIGGINETNISKVSEAKADLIAIVNAIYGPNSIKENILNLQNKIN